MKIIGSSFSVVVTTCTPPPMRTPSRLMPTKIQISDAACTTGDTASSPGSTLPR